MQDKGDICHIEGYDRFFIWANSKLKHTPALFYPGLPNTDDFKTVCGVCEGFSCNTQGVTEQNGGDVIPGQQLFH